MLQLKSRNITMYDIIEAILIMTTGWHPSIMHDNNTRSRHVIRIQRKLAQIIVGSSLQESCQEKPDFKHHAFLYICLIFLDS